jgi:hypothetical protein
VEARSSPGSRSQQPITLFPNLKIERRRSAVEVVNTVMETGLQVGADLLPLFDFLARPRTIGAVRRKFSGCDDVLTKLLDAFVVIHADRLDVFAPGLLAAAQ